MYVSVFNLYNSAMPGIRNHEHTNCMASIGLSDTEVFWINGTDKQFLFYIHSLFVFFLLSSVILTL